MDDFMAFVAEVMEVDPSQLGEDSAYGSIPQWDSLMQMRLVMEIEGRYGVDLPMEAIGSPLTLAEFYRYVEG